MSVVASPAAVLTPRQLTHAVTPGQLTIHQDRVVYTVRRCDEHGERVELWSTDYVRGGARPLTSPRGRDHCPRISPDGERVAFLREGEDAPAQVWLLEFGTGAERALTTFARGAHDLDWFPDGRALAVLAEDEESPLVHRAEGVGAAVSPTALVLRRADWRRDGETAQGLRLYPRHLHRVPLGGGRCERLTHGAWSASRPRVDAAGRVHFLADRTDGADLAPAPQVHRVGPGGGTPEGVTAFAGGVLRYHLIDGGVRVLAHAQAEPADDRPARLYDVRDGAVHDVRPADERWLGLLGDETDLHEWQLDLDDAARLSTASADGSTRPVDADSGRALIDGPVVCGAVAADGERRVGVLALGDGAYAPDVYALDAGGARRLTDHGAWLARYRQPESEWRELPGPAGPVSVHLLHPDGDRRPRATVLLLHGGPTGQWGVVPTAEALLLAAAGYLVAMPNIRGSIDRGRPWVAALRGAWGRADAEDALAVCDALVGDGLTDPDRLGVTGLSYGGFLTQWLIGVTDRFAAAVAENGVTNQVSSWANCDTGPVFCRSAGLGDPLSADGVERLWACSPLRNVAAVHTPVLMLQAADDRICPAADNEQFFLALRALRREAEYVIYPEESHLMQATGRIDRRIDRHLRALAWFDRYLGQ